MMAHQVAAKAARDSFFLTVMPASDLPSMVMAAAVISVGAVPVYARMMARFGPARVVPAGFVISTAAHVAEWLSPELTPTLAILIYVHLAALGALLLSGFWSLASETFDPITAKRSYGRIAASGTLGGVAGGLAAERIAASVTPASVLLLLAVLHGLCATLVLMRKREERVTADEEPVPALALSGLQTVPHLKPIAAVVIAGTASAAVLDYLFKSQAAAHYEGAALLRFFAVFYVVTQIATFFLQTIVTNRALSKRGVGGTIGALPASVGLGSIAALFVPALPLFAVARGVESAIRGSLFRSGYELLFNPMGPAEKRRAKAFLDVACDRAGDAIGAGIVQLALVTIPAFLMSALLGVVVTLSIGSMWLARRLNAFYARQVERGLVNRAELIREDVDVTGWATQQGSLAGLSSPAPSAVAPVRTSREADSATRLFAMLRSGDRAAVRRALASEDTAFEAAHVAQIVQLLAWNDVCRDVQATLVRLGSAHVGLLVDYLLSHDADFAIRRRLPRVLAEMPSPRALEGLLAGLDDPRFEVRYRCSRAIDRLRLLDAGLRPDNRRIFAALRKELDVPESVGRSYAVIDPDDGADPDAFPSGGRTNRRVEYVFSLLAAVLAREPLKAAYRAVHTDDRLLRGLALDYLNGVLPAELRPAFWALLDVDAQGIQQVDPAKAADDLIRTQDTSDVRASVSDAPAQSGQPPASTRPSEEA
jgi:AAA family ATP:ADP antiporter